VRRETQSTATWSALPLPKVGSMGDNGMCGSVKIWWVLDVVGRCPRSATLNALFISEFIQNLQSILGTTKPVLG
jgi:hypothetical protein